VCSGLGFRRRLREIAAGEGEGKEKEKEKEKG